KLCVVKTLTHEAKHKRREQAQREVTNLTALFHPCVAALLGSFSGPERFHILLFPLACCDLNNIMERVCGVTAKARDAMVRRSESSNAVQIDSNEAPHTLTAVQGERTLDRWKTSSLEGLQRILKRCFFSLSEALKYI